MNYLNKNKKGFSLIELMVVMGIAAAILVLGIAGFQLAQRQSRDQERRNTLVEIGEQINEYRIINLTLPDRASVQFNTDSVLIDGVNTLELERHTRADNQTSNLRTKYYYDRSGGGFILCAELESGAIAKGGTVDCPATLP